MTDIVNLFSAGSANIPSKFEKILASSFFKRFFIAWLIWNWRVLFIMFVISDDTLLLVADNPVNKIDYVIYLYPFPYNLFILFFGPAITTVAAYFFLEICNIICFWFKKTSWKFRVKIENSFEENTEMPLLMVSTYSDTRNDWERKKRETEIRIISNEKEIREKNELLEKKETELDDQRKKLNDLLKEKEMTEEDLVKKARELIELINIRRNAKEIWKVFYETFKLLMNDGRCKIENPSPILISLVEYLIFIKEAKGTFVNTRLAEKINALLNFEYNNGPE